MHYNRMKSGAPNVLRTWITCWVVVATWMGATGQTNMTEPTLRSAPAAPIQPVPFGEWEEAYDLSNQRIRAVIVPRAGRMMHLSFLHQPNVLRRNEASEGSIPPPDSEDWINHGGDWLWPLAQSHWPALTGSNWPPARLIEGRPWTGRGWVQADGSQTVELSIEYGKPLNARAVRKFTLAPGTGEILVEQQIVRTGPSSYPMSLWHITQVDSPDLALMPTVATEPDRGLHPMMFGYPSPDHLTYCDDYVVYRPESDNRKIGGRARPAWIAALRGDTLILEVMTEPNPEAPHPDEDSTIQMYSQPGNYIEIETLGEERILEEGERLTNTLRIGLLKQPDADSPCDWSDAISQFLSRPPGS